jgi:hypothetical protein
MTCNATDGKHGKHVLVRQSSKSSVYVSCDEDCHALYHPETLEEYAAALEHWKNHGYQNGCAHAR